MTWPGQRGMLPGTAARQARRLRVAVAARDRQQDLGPGGLGRRCRVGARKMFQLPTFSLGQQTQWVLLAARHGNPPLSQLHLSI